MKSQSGGPGGHLVYVDTGVSGSGFGGWYVATRGRGSVNIRVDELVRNRICIVLLNVCVLSM